MSLCKYYKQKRIVSYDSGSTWQDVSPAEYRVGGLYELDSPDCSEGESIIRWVLVPGDYLCEDKDKYEKEIEQYSTDNGQTWLNIYPATYRKGSLIESNSTLCNNKWEGHYITTTEESGVCPRWYRWVDGIGCVYVDPIKFIRCETSSSTTLTREDITYIPYSLFYGTIGDCVTSIGSSAFTNCSGLTSVEIPNSVTSIGDSAFNSCSGITSVNIPSGVTSIGERAFYGCTSLPVIDNIRYADTYAVEAVDKALTTYTLKNDTKWIGSSAFSDCTSFTSIDIPSGVTSIGNNAFYRCTSLTSIDIPSGVTSISYGVFYNCISLTSIAIPSGVTTIGEYAFYGCRSLTSITIPNSVTTIGQSAFDSCWSLSSCTIGSGVTSIDNYVFQGCSGLTSIDIPSGVTSIGYGAFTRCNRLRSIVIPDSVTSIYDMAFYGCSGLTSITINATTPPTLDTAFGGVQFDDTNNCPIYVPSASVNAYKSAFVWSSYSSRITAIP